MKFVKYDKFDGSWQINSVAYLREKGFDNPSIEWSVSEKVHGSNFSLWCNGDSILYARRGQFLSTDEDFYGCNRILPKLMQKIWDVWNGESCTQLVIYGELFGGNYPHDDVKPVQNAKKIQKKIYYTPENDFYAFDIMIDEKIINVNEFEKICEIYNILHAKSLMRGPFDECLKYPNDFDTTIPAILGLPEIKGNMCEGVVLKTVMPMYYENDSGRLMLKNKNKKYREKTKKRPKKIISLSDEGNALLSEINDYITENRLDNVLSKVGSFTKKDFAKVQKLYLDDVYEDYERENGKIDRDHKDWKEIERQVRSLCADTFRPIFLERI